MVTAPRTKLKVTWRTAYFRICVLLLVSLIIEVPLIIVLGESGLGLIGLILSLLVCVVSVVLATRIMIVEYRRSWRDPQKYRNRRVYFSIDMVAYAISMLGVVMRAGAPNYGQIYEQVGFALSAAAFLLLAGGLIWTIVEYYRSKDKFMLILAFTLGWFSMIGSLALLLLPGKPSGS